MLNLNEFQNKLHSNQIMALIISSLIALLITIFSAYTILTGNKGASTRTPPVVQNSNRETTPVPTDYYGLPTPLPDEVVPTGPPTPAPQPGDIIIDGIAVNDFRENAARITANNDVVLVENEEYQIIFYHDIQEFKLYLTGENFEQTQMRAEEAFLNALGIDEESACQLFVEVFVPSTVQNKHAGQILPLNFCYHEHEPSYL